MSQPTEATLSDAVLPALPGPDAAPLAPWPGSYQEVDDTRIFVRRTPPSSDDAEPALYVHGLDGSSTNWTDLAYLLAGRLNGEAPDLPGFGLSDRPARGGYRLDTHVRVASRLIEARGEPVHLFGNSLGGAVATRLAAQRPELVRTLTLVSPALPSLRLRRDLDPRLGLLLVPGLAGLVQRTLARAEPEERVRRVIELCYANPGRVHPQRLAEAAEELRRRLATGWAAAASLGSLRGLVASYLDPGPRALWRQARRVQAPTLLIWGRQDRLVSVRLAARAVRVYPHARLLVLDDCGHVAMMEAPETTARAVLSLLDSSAGTGTAKPPTVEH